MNVVFWETLVFFLVYVYFRALVKMCKVWFIAYLVRNMLTLKSLLHVIAKDMKKKIPHTGDKASLDRCG